MSKLNFFSDLINSLFDKTNRKKNFSFLFEKKQSKSLYDYIENIYEAKGEISALSYSEELFDLLDEIDDKTFIKFLHYQEKNSLMLR